MKYFLDTEFIEKPGSIQLISIGIVTEDGNEYYAISNEFSLAEVWKNDWLVKNVMAPIYREKVHGDMRNHVPFGRRAMKGIIKGFGKSNAQIAKEIMEFVYSNNDHIFPETCGNFDEMMKVSPIEFYGYYADYDWVVFCWLFGKMIDLPKGFPMFCMDLKQMMVERGLNGDWKRKVCPDPENEHNALADAKWNLDLYGKVVEYNEVVK